MTLSMQPQPRWLGFFYGFFGSLSFNNALKIQDKAKSGVWTKNNYRIENNGCLLNLLFF